MTIGQRKADHIDLCSTGDVAFSGKTTLLDQVELLHDALPELHVDQVDTSTTILGKPLRAPIIIAAMTGGTERAVAINRELASIAEERGYGFGLGSQRPMLSSPQDPSYCVRDIAPNCLLLGNLAAVQARDLPPDRLSALVETVGADALCLHLNPAMELIQTEGDRDFTGVLDALAKLNETLTVPVIAKETGCGISPSVAARLAAAGIRHLDVSGAGGTSWVAVETQRADDAHRTIGETLREWGVPTAASICYAHATEPHFDTIIATGGIKTGLDIARSIALGAHAGGIARPILQAQQSGGREKVIALLNTIESELRSTMLLVGAANIDALRASNFVARGELRDWLSLLSEPQQQS